MKRFTQAAALVLLMVTAPFVMSESQQKEAASKPKIAIIIDDLGYQIESVRTLTQLSQPITFAVIPFTPFAERAIETAQSAHREVILHVPMETMHKEQWESGLNSEMDQEELTGYMQSMLERYPQAVGVNNHGGSKLTADALRMQWVMESLANRDLYFLDSRTTSDSFAEQAAQAANLAYATRDVFLDNVKTAEAIDEQIRRLKRIAQKRGYAIAIGHPYPETIEALKLHLPLLEQEGFELTFCSELVKMPESKLAGHTEALKN